MARHAEAAAPPTSDRGGDQGIMGKCLMLAGPGGGAETSEGWRGTWGSPAHRPLQRQLRARLHHVEDYEHGERMGGFREGRTAGPGTPPHPPGAGKQTVSPRALGGTHGRQLPQCPSPDLAQDPSRDALSWCVTTAAGAPPWLAVSRARKAPPGYSWGGSHPLNPTRGALLRTLPQAVVPASLVE